MKRFTLALIVFFSFSLSANAIEEVNLEFNQNFQKHSINVQKSDNKTKITEEEIPDVEDIDKTDLLKYQTDISPSSQVIQAEIQKSIFEKAQDFWAKQPDRTDDISPLFKEQLTWHLNKGPLESLYTRAVVQTNMDIMIPEDGDSYSKYDVNLINILVDGKSRDAKDTYRIMFDVSPQHKRPFMQQFIQDLFYETKRIPHHSILIGNSRVGTGMEGTQSPYTLPFLQRSQISRNFSNIRKVGVRIRGDYKYAEYDFGAYSSDTFFSEFMPGAEFNSWVNFKPLANTNGKYGKLLTGAGVSLGKRNSTGYFVGGAGIEYSYKKFRTRMEYSIANGSNGATGLSNKKRQGWYVTVGYKLHKKIEVLARYDEFDPDRYVHNNHIREYTAGINYYIKGQALKLVLNYIFRQNQTGSNSHRILIGTQIAL